MKPAQLLRAILPDVLIDNFDIVNFDKSADRFDIYLDEKKVQLKEDKINPDIISYGFGEYRTIQDYPIRGRATYLHVRKRKWLDKGSIINLINTFLPVFFHKKDDYYHLLSRYGNSKQLFFTYLYP